MKKEKDITKNIDNTKRENIDLKEFMLLDTKKQSEKIDSMLKEMYDGSIEVSKKHIEKVLNISFDVADNEIYLPHSLKVEKIGSKLIFSFKKKNNWTLIILFLLSFLFIGGAATYSGIYYLSLQGLNIDLDGDGVADLNIDITDNGICDVNCDINKDNRPERNIDYQGNRKPTFNVLQDDDTIFNPMNQDTNDDGICDLNCDSNNDGWPDYNIDLDGDGKADIAIDVDGDRIPDLNIDTNGDGVADVNIDNDGDGKCDVNCVSNSANNKELNIDTNGDNKCDINCDTNDDNKPDRNIDYEGNKEPTFNVEDKNGNIKNPMNQNKDGKCVLNCDTNDDGWPNTNIDLDGDGKADVNIDIDGDGNPDLNIDTDKDGKPDINIDTDGDNICDMKCAIVVSKDGTHNFAQEGNGSAGIGTARSLIVVFENQNEIISDHIYPDDQPEVNSSIPDLKFTVQNTTGDTLYYDLKWLVKENTFVTTNFWYKVTSNNDGYNHDWITAPFKDENISTHIAIAPNTTQSYSISMTLHGTGAEQNEDQGRNFSGKIQVALEE